MSLVAGESRHLAADRLGAVAPTRLVVARTQETVEVDWKHPRVPSIRSADNASQVAVLMATPTGFLSAIRANRRKGSTVEPTHRARSRAPNRVAPHRALGDAPDEQVWPKRRSLRQAPSSMSQCHEAKDGIHDESARGVRGCIQSELAGHYLKRCAALSVRIYIAQPLAQRPRCRRFDDFGGWTQYRLIRARIWRSSVRWGRDRQR